MQICIFGLLMTLRNKPTPTPTQRTVSPSSYGSSTAVSYFAFLLATGAMSCFNLDIYCPFPSLADKFHFPNPTCHCVI